ncbi:MAG: hypothetical protein AAF901_14425, partial [Bacteroidota bacterium]
LLKAPAGSLFAILSVYDITNDNLNDVVLYEIDSDFNIIDSTAFNFSTVDNVLAAVSVGENIISFIRSASSISGNQYFLTSINTADHSILSDIEITYGSGTMNLASNGVDNVVVGFLERNSGTLAGYNPVDGTENFIMNMLPFSACGNSNYRLFTNSLIYDGVNNKYLIFNSCQGAIEIDPLGGWQIVWNDTPNPNGIGSQYAQVDKKDDEFRFFSDTRHAKLVREENAYVTTGAYNVSGLTSAKSSPIVENGFITVGVGTNNGPKLEVRRDQNYLPSIELEDLGIRRASYYSTFSHHVADQDALYAKKGNQIIQYNLSSEIFDTLSFPFYTIQDIASHPIGGVFALLEDDYTFTYTIVRCDFVEGSFDTIYQGDFQFSNSENGRPHLEMDPNGNFYVHYYGESNTSVFLREQVRKINSEGVEIYNTELGGVFVNFEHSVFMVDDLGNAYVSEHYHFCTHSLAKITPDGSIAYSRVITLDSDQYIIKLNNMVLDGSGRLVMAGERSTESILYLTEALGESVLFYVDALTGDYLSKKIINNQNVFPGSTWVVFYSD